MCLMLPSGMELFQPEAKKSYRIDVVPYEVGEHNPYCRDKGAWYYEMTYWVHRGIGPNQESFCCPAKMRKERCPVCEHRNQIERKGCPEGTDRKLWWRNEVAPYQSKERQLWLVHERGHDDEKVMLWDVSHHLFGKLLDQLRQSAQEDETHKIAFDDWEAGSLLSVTFAENKGEAFSFIEAIGIEFIPRKKGLNPSLLDHGINLEAIPIVPSYEELKKAFMQVDDEEPEDDDDEDEPAPRKPEAKKGPAKPKPAQEDNPAEDAGLEVGMTVKVRRLGVCKIKKISNDGTSITVLGEDGEIHGAVAVDEIRKIEQTKPAKNQVEDDEDDDPAPVKKPAKKPARDEDDWDDEDEPAPAKKPAKKPAKDDDWEDDENPPKKSARSAEGSTATKAKSAPSRSDDDGWGDEDDEPAPKKSAKPAKKAAKDEDDWD